MSKMPRAGVEAFGDICFRGRRGDCMQMRTFWAMNVALALGCGGSDYSEYFLPTGSTGTATSGTGGTNESTAVGAGGNNTNGTGGASSGGAGSNATGNGT